MHTGTPSGFSSLNLSPKLLAAIDRLGFSTPTPIQEKVIPLAVDGKDVVGIAQTGTGKTLAFGLPMIQRIGRGHGNGLVLVPTRELAIQVNDHFAKVGVSVGLRTAVLIGGESMSKQLKQLAAKPHVIIATPGRLLDHLTQRTVSLDASKILVLDEADRMLDMGFAPQLNKIMERVPKVRQTMLFSATMPQSIMRMAGKYLVTPLRVEIAPQGTAAERVTHELFVVSKEQKMALLESVLTHADGTVLMFVRTKHGAKKITRQLSVTGHKAAEIHSNRSLNQRREALEGFKKGKYRILVATDIAARGIDVTGIGLVLNFDLPQNPEDYVHRIGRTGRAGLSGRAISFAMPDQRRDVRDIERLIRFEIKPSPLPVLPQRTLGPKAFVPQFRQAQRPAGFRGGNRPPRRHHRRFRR